MLTVHDPRIEIEHALLWQYFGTTFWFANEDGLCAEIGLRTNSGQQYAVRFVLPDGYPDALPEALVTHPKPLIDHDGRCLADFGPSSSMHILEGHDGFTSICHYHPARWAADMTLYKVAMKARIWLEAYEIHLRTGDPIDTYLAHMKECP